MTQERLRKSLRWKILRVLWITAGGLSRWAGRRMVDLSRNADAEGV